MTQPSTATAFTAEQALTQLASNDYLWKEKVTDANWYNKPFGVISYFLNKDAVQDSCTRLCKLVAEYAESKNTKKDKLELSKQTEKALKAFYNTFSSRVKQIGVEVSDAKFAVFAQAASQLISKTSELTKTGYALTFKEEIKKLSKTDFAATLFKRTAKDAVSQIETITAEGIRGVVQSLKSIFASNTTENIALEVRKAAHKKHGSALAARGTALTAAAADVNSDLFKAAKAANEKTLKDEETRLDAERIALAGKDWENRAQGQLDPAFQAQEAARKAMIDAQAAKDASKAKIFAEIGGVTAATPDEDLANFNGAPSLPEFRENFKRFQDAKVAFEAAEKIFNELKTKYETEVVAKLASVRAKLVDATLVEFTKTQMTKNAELATELGFDPSAMNFNASARAAALQAIVGY